ncbi:MAG: hypothetical protein HN534_04485 [Euryarchaeota archaeon]|jgi:hypothetical protein|nr:hypothetical protein [Euryarchaeota archaeon]MBT3654168.1 hypothetical protein [Euryarchaeota archaeon]MBT3757084.1 hypothetical protein [Euryarchaeota archaeon]MBT4050252.1 hypothetical protein [Euryarchaeota archaeon]MBT4346297.1 hypothetical protein [Euryarchaeota archaeon]|tara:strand:+ start:7947 stop:8567 length:621 start_codon:yes stop_codon:yes gene_type:complete
MDHPVEDGGESPRIDVRALPESVAQLWETMLRLDPTWNIAAWLDERATEELQLVEGQLGRERLRLEQRLHRIETLAKRLKRQREVSDISNWGDPHQKNLFDVYEPETMEIVNSAKECESQDIDSPAVDFNAFGVGDDPLLAIVAEHIMSMIETAYSEGPEPIHFDTLMDELDQIGIRADEVEEAVQWLLQREMIIEIGQDYFGLDI